MKDKDLLKILFDHGWSLKRITGSHHILVKDGFLTISLPIHGKELKKGLENAILKQAGLKDNPGEQSGKESI